MHIVARTTFSPGGYPQSPETEAFYEAWGGPLVAALLICCVLIALWRR